MIWSHTGFVNSTSSSILIHPFSCSPCTSRIIVHMTALPSWMVYGQISANPRRCVLLCHDWREFILRQRMNSGPNIWTAGPEETYRGASWLCFHTYRFGILTPHQNPLAHTCMWEWQLTCSWSVTLVPKQYSLVPCVLETSVLPIWRMLNIEGALTSYQSFLEKGSTL